MLGLRVAGRFGEQILTIIAAARPAAPTSYLLDVRPASPAVRQVLEITGWPGPRASTGNEETGSRRRAW